MNKKVLISALTLIFFLISIPIGVYLVQQQQEIRERAAPATVLSLSPSTLSKNPGEEFSLAVTIETGENLVAAADVTLTFDSTKLTAINVVQGTFLSTVLKAGEISPGAVRFAYANQPAKQGAGTLATVYFKVKEDTTSGSAQISFSPQTQIGGVGETGNVLIGTTPSTVTITGETIPSPTPTPTVTLTPTLTPTPTPTTAGQGGGTIPTSTPTPTTAAGTTPTPTPTSTLTVSPEELPVTGILTPTFFLSVSGGLLLFFAVLLII